VVNGIVIVVALISTAATVLWFWFGRRNPETAAGHSEPDRTGSGLFFGDSDDRPAGPGAEADGVAGPGQPMPGPSAESGG
jgi:hypothetical protein